MKYPFIRRAGALALALVLTATMSLSLIAPARAADTPVESVTLDKNTLSLAVGGTETLTATVKPDSATDKTVNWSSDKEEVATVTDGKVTAVSTGEATITAAVGENKATCKVTVVDVRLTIVSGGSGGTAGDVTWTSGTAEADKVLSAQLNVKDANPTVKWTVTPEPGQAGVVAPILKENGSVVTVKEQTAGVFIVTAACEYNGKTYDDSIKLTVSGILLSGTNLKTETNEKTQKTQKTLTMVVNGSAILTATLVGAAAADTTTSVEWTSSDSSTVSVMNNSGNLNAWGIGTAVITATKGDYWAECTVEVEEDTSVIADEDENGNRYTASTSDPLTLDTVYPKLNEICEKKTKDYGEYKDKENDKGFGLDYITNVSVSPNQGTLYYNYSTESDTGYGVGYNDQFAEVASGSRRGLDKLYFVPKQGFSGTAEITFSAITENRRNIAGIIRVEVGADSTVYQISYRAQAGEPAWFLSDDFNTYCQNANGRDFSYIIFNLPKSSEGVLYYNYLAGTGNPVTTTTRFTSSGRYTIDDVCFVPNTAFQGEAVTISFRAVDTSGTTIDGTVTVNVIALSTDDDFSSVTVSGERGQPVTLQGELFNAACQATIHDTLSFVTFKLPDPDVGALFVNYQSEEIYESRVTTGTRCYYSGTPGLGSVSFVPASNAAGRIAISYTGHGSGGASYSGTLYIALGEVNRSVIHYTVTKDDDVTFSASDFNTAGRYAVGSNVSFVVFTGISSEKLGTLRWRNTSTNTPAVKYSSDASDFTSEYVYYVSTTGSQRGLNKVFFDAKSTAGTVTISYTAFSGTISKPTELFNGTVVIQVGTVSPNDIALSCKTGGYANLSAITVDSVCGTVMSKNPSYIEITSVPDAEVGHLYFNYDPTAYGTGTVVKPGERFYGFGTPNIDKLVFVPHARFTGEAVITYIAYSGDGQEQVSGRIVVTVTASTTSYFTDMGGHTWAIDSVEYLRRNGTVKGVGGTSYDPGGTVKRGDFVLMLVRAYGFTARGSSPFKDVPAGSYYAEAIRIAYLTDIISGNNGYFYPNDALTRQDAMVMIYNALNASGKATTNGLTADFSVYHDAEEIASYAREAMGSLLQMGVIQGVGNGYLEPRRQLNRAEAAMLMHTIMTL